MIKFAHLIKNWFINMSYYAVAKGRFPGVYYTWADCKKQVDHFPGAKYRKFPSEKAARDFITEQNPPVVPNEAVCCEHTVQLPQPEKQDAIPNNDFIKKLSTSIPTADKDVIQNGEDISNVLIQKQLTQLEQKSKSFRKKVKAELAELREKFQMLDERLIKIETKFLYKQDIGHNIVSTSVTGIGKVEKILDEEFGQLKERLNSLKDKKLCERKTDDSKTHRQKLKETLMDQNIPKALGPRSEAITSSSLQGECPGGKRKFSSSQISEGKTVKVHIKDCNPEGSSGAPFIVDEDGYVVVYTDGACEENGRRGARAGIGVWFGDNHPLNIAEPVVGKATNNMAEIQAATYAVETAKKAGIKKLVVHTDSKFLINCITEWINKWKKNDWRVTGGQPVKNKDELIVLDNKLQGIDVKWKHVRGHCGLHGNEMADQLAREGAKRYVDIDCNDDF